MRLNLGCADTVVHGFINVDLSKPGSDTTPETYQQVDLAGRWPWLDSSISEVLAKDVIEHVGDFVEGRGIVPVQWPWGWNRNPSGRIHFMNELHRVLVAGGRAVIETPNASRGCGYFQDPTHVSPWCLSTFKYFEVGTFAHTRLAALYGITAAFRVVELTERQTPGEDPRETVYKIRAVLEAAK